MASLGEFFGRHWGFTLQNPSANLRPAFPSFRGISLNLEVPVCDPTASLFVMWAIIVLILWLSPPCLSQRRVGRCDQEREVRRWSKCAECSLNALMTCSSRFKQLTKGEGSQRCSFRAYFGFRFGYVNLRGCQHLCARKRRIKECCDGFWGPDCQGNLIYTVRQAFLTDLNCCSTLL